MLTKVWRLRASGLLPDDSRHFLKVFGETFKICSAYSLSVSEKASLWSRRSLTNRSLLCPERSIIMAQMIPVNQMKGRQGVGTPSGLTRLLVG